VVVGEKVAQVLMAAQPQILDLDNLVDQVAEAVVMLIVTDLQVQEIVLL
jgi:hypothetical protein